MAYYRTLEQQGVLRWIKDWPALEQHVREWQRDENAGQPLGFILYTIAAFAETNRAPFDLPEAEQELVAGYHTEYSGFRFAMYFIAEYVNVLTVSAIAATVFFGGWTGPFNLLPGPWWLLLKMTVFAFIFVWVRATLPRLRYDQLMRLSWGFLLPLGLLNVLVTAIVVVLLTQGAR